MPREHPAPAPPELIAGSLAYMAPEPTGRMNRALDARSDLYALGVTFYQMLTGVLPFTASDPLEWVHCHIARRPVAPAERVPDLPEAVSAIIMKCLAKTAEDRYQSAAGVAADLQRCLAEWEDAGAIGLDAATLDLLDHLVTEPGLRHLLLIGAYRDNEVTAAHPLRRRLVAMRAAAGRASEIVLAPLALGDVDRMVADALHCAPAQAALLARLIHEKTGGQSILRHPVPWRDIPVIALSACVYGSDQQGCLEAGANTFLPKPIDYAQLLAKLADLLRIRWLKTAPVTQTPLPTLEAGAAVPVPPAAEMANLHRLARMGNMVEILAWADRITRLDDAYRPFAAQLIELARNYQSKAILSMVQRHLD